MKVDEWIESFNETEMAIYSALQKYFSGEKMIKVFAEEIPTEKWVSVIKKEYSKHFSILGSQKEQEWFRIGILDYIPLAHRDEDWDYLILRKTKREFWLNLLCRITNVDIHLFNSLFNMQINRKDEQAVNKAMAANVLRLMVIKK